MPASTWNQTVINGVNYLVISAAQFYIPLDWDPSSNMFIAVAAPNAGLGNLPALLQGDAGPAPGISQTINFTPLDPTDPTPDSASWSTIGTNLYQLNLALHKGAAGSNGTMAILQAIDLANANGSSAQAALAGAASAQPTQIMVVNSTADGFVFASQRVGDRYVPGAITAAPSGNSLWTLCPIIVGAQKFDWRPDVEFSAIISPTGADISVDLIARLSNTNPDGGATTGNDVGRAIGLPSTGTAAMSQSIISGPPVGAGDTWDRVPKGQIATIFCNAERQVGSDYFTISSTQVRARVRVCPCPTDLT